ncbi:alpha/beta hydrolase [Amycolatopsis jiangsuensis]|uniref:Acetyl esterase n=1 Tax=Amycolatopsis jiangsuensis TaxID=1181879 RepID=A0A840J3G7_9PSEU|nr:alpha/beta hydrolase [Amycolatopsis jiangsuensis]MBB4689616.1 acetyl esterase [Amycolatopsis jiangsuensis]
MSSRSGLKRADGQRLSLFLANLAGPTAPILHAVARHPSATARGILDAVFATVGGDQRQGVSEKDLVVDGAGGTHLAARLYTPWGVGADSALLVYCPGGGFVLGSVASHANTCRFVAREGQCRVLAIDYRKAPEYRFPVPLDDSVAAFRWAVAHAAELKADPSRIGVGGDSAGANLAAGVCLETADDAVSPRAAWLVYPFVDAELGEWPSASLFGSGPLLSTACARDMLTQYAPVAADQRDGRVSVLRHERLDRMPPTYVATAGMDPLRDQGEALARRLVKFGVPVRNERFTRLPHGFMQLLIDRHARAAASRASRELPGLLTASTASAETGQPAESDEVPSAS